VERETTNALVNFLHPLAVMPADFYHGRHVYRSHGAAEGYERFVTLAVLMPRIMNGAIMLIIALCAGLLLASTAAYADPRGIWPPDDMQTARANIRADKRATALAKLNGRWKPLVSNPFDPINLFS
jgi:hypothetical protein